MIREYIRRKFKRAFATKYIFFSVIADKIFFFIYFLLLARLFDKPVYGEVITAFTFCNIAAFFVSFGIPVYIQRTVAINKFNSTKEINITLFILTLLIFIYFPLILFITVSIFPSIELIVILLIGIIVYLFNYISLINSIYNGIEEYKKFFQLLFTIKFIGLFIILLLYYLKINNVNFFLFALLITVLSQFLLQIIFLRVRYFKFSFKGIRLIYVKELLLVLLPLYLASVFNFMYDKIDVLLISKFIGFQEVANYSIAYGIYKSTAIFFMPLLVSGYTKISYLSNRNFAVIIFIRKYATLISIICFIVIIFILIFSQYIIVFLYSSKFIESTSVLRILSIAVIFMGLNNLLGSVLNGLGKFKENRNVTLLCLLINVLLNIIFIPLYGIIAAAVTTVITEFLVMIGDAFYLRKFIFLKLY